MRGDFYQEGSLKAYAGVGARHTPLTILPIMTAVGHQLKSRRYVLRSGHAPGADQAFEEGAEERAEIFLPWPNYERDARARGRVYPEPATEAFEIARAHHPRWSHLKSGTQALHARNAHIVLGRALDEPVEFVVCWTFGGRDVGGTGMTLRVARAYGIRIFNLYDARLRDALGVGK